MAATTSEDIRACSLGQSLNVSATHPDRASGWPEVLPPRRPKPVHSMRPDCADTPFTVCC